MKNTELKHQEQDVEQSVLITRRHRVKRVTKKRLFS